MTSNIQHILQQGEGLKIEFKTSFNIETIETLVAFANAKGGMVCVGVKDTGKVIGTQLGKESVPQWINEIKSKTEPSIIPEVSIVKIEDKQVALFSIAEFPVKPVAIQGKYYKNITFYNPGKLYGNLTIEELETNTYQASARNKLIAEAFYLTGDIEKYGSGFRRIRKEIEQYPTMNLECAEIPNGFLATISYTERKISSENIAEFLPEKVTKKVTKKVTENQQVVLNKMAIKPTISAEELSSILGISLRKTKENIAKLKANDLIERVGPNKGGYWKIKKY